MGRPPVVGRDDALLAELGQEQHVRDTAVDEPRGRDAEREQPLRSAEHAERGLADGPDHLGEPRVGAVGLDRGGPVQRDAGARGVAALKEATRFARQPLPHGRPVVLGERPKERRREELRRVLERDAIRPHHSSLIRSTARNASCGISTAPTIFMRFLPAFCFSSSFFFRVMSPP